MSVEQPTKLRPYIFHGVFLAWNKEAKDAIGNCPFCGKEGKFGVKISNGTFNCWSCRKQGNIFKFLNYLLEASTTTEEEYETFAENRGILYTSTLRDWKIVKSPITGEWLVPGYGQSRKLSQLYKYTRTSDGMRLHPTPTLGHKLHGLNLWGEGKKIETVYICEGPWDAIALWEVMLRVREQGDELRLTTDKRQSLIQSANIIATPGVMVFKEQWSRLFKDKKVCLLYDNDHPGNDKQGRFIESAGLQGTYRTAGLLSKCSSPPHEISYLEWGENGYSLDLPSGYDVRDKLREGPKRSLGSRLEALGSLLGDLRSVPVKALRGRLGREREKGSSGTMDLLDCTEYQQLQQAWREALEWTEGLDRALSVMLAAVTSTKAIGDQLWIKVIGPASSGKSTLCEALSTCEEYVLAKSTLRGFHSGFVTDANAEEDHSLIAKLRDKTFITKDGDTLLQSPNLSQILSEARDLYDTVSRTSYRNKASKDYTGVRMTWLLCGTSSLRSIDNSELGERFLDCVIMDGIDDELEDEILWRVANRANNNLSIEADGRPETYQEKEMTVAMQLTGGYVRYLRENATVLLGSIDYPKKLLIETARLGKFVAYMRARPSVHQEETSEREFGARLVSQLIRLSKCLAVVHNENEVTPGIMEITKRVALDTSRGITLDLLSILYKEGGKDIRGLSAVTNRSTYHTVKLLRFLRKLGAVQPYQTKTKHVRSQVKWRLTEYLDNLCEEVLGEL